VLKIVLPSSELMQYCKSPKQTAKEPKRYTPIISTMLHKNNNLLQLNIAIQKININNIKTGLLGTRVLLELLLLAVNWPGNRKTGIHSKVKVKLQLLQQSDGPYAMKPVPMSFVAFLPALIICIYVRGKNNVYGCVYRTGSHTVISDLLV